MRITLIQDKIHWSDKNANLLQVENHLQDLAGKTDLVVLPEMFSTGFCTDNAELAEDMQGKTISTVREWATEYRFAITGSFIASENGKIFNRSFFVFPDSAIRFADKRHLFSMGGENQIFEPGNSNLLVRYCGFNIRVLVCYDIRFPVWARNVANAYDLLIFVANFPQSRINSWDVLLKARAIENQTYVCGVNCIGVDGNGIAYNGHSALLDFKANPILEFPESDTSIQTSWLDIEKLKKFREKSAFWKDADQFEII